MAEPRSLWWAYSVLPILFLLTLVSDTEVLYGNDAQKCFRQVEAL